MKEKVEDVKEQKRQTRSPASSQWTRLPTNRYSIKVYLQITDLRGHAFFSIYGRVSNAPN